MQVYRYFRFRVYPTAAQEKRLGEWNDALRFLWNLAHEQRIMGLARTNKRYPTAFEQSREVTLLRAELPWLADVPYNVCSQLLVELDNAWQRCFKRIYRAPRFKRQGRDSLSFCENHQNVWRLDDANIRFPKLGTLRTVLHRPLEGKPKTCTLKRDGDQWFASIVCEIEVPESTVRAVPVVAIDRGVTNVTADSDGRIVPNPKHLDVAMKRLARAQRSVSRKKKGSKNRVKAQVRVMRIHRKVRRQREHFLHGLSHDYAKSHGVVVVEKLQIASMTRSASGTRERPGRRVSQKRGLNRSVMATGWGAFVAMLRYKMAWSGGSVIDVPAQYSSQMCHGCGHVDAASRKGERFCCTGCGLTEHADVNAAKVLLQRFQTPGNPWCLPVDGSACKGPERSRKRLRVPKRRAAENPGL